MDRAHRRSLGSSSGGATTTDAHPSNGNVGPSSLLSILPFLAVSGQYMTTRELELSTFEELKSKGDLFFDKREYRLAAKYFSQLTRMPGGHLELADIWRKLGRIMAMAGRAKEAHACFQRSLRQDAEDERTWYLTAVLHQRQGDLKEALRCFDRVIELNLSSGSLWSRENRSSEDITAKAELQLAMAYTGRAEVQLKLGHVDEALESVARAVSTTPRAAESRLLMGEVLEALGRKEDAVRSYHAALRLDPDRWSLLARMGALQHDLGLAHDAVDSYVDYLRANPKDKRIWLHLSMVLDDMGRHEDALRVLDRTMELDGDNDMVWTQRGLVQEHAGDREAAMASYSEALLLKPGNRTAQRAIETLEKQVDDQE